MRESNLHALKNKLAHHQQEHNHILRYCYVTEKQNITGICHRNKHH